MFHRPAARLGALALVAGLFLAACGSEQTGILDDFEGKPDFSAVTIAGKPGQEPEVTWKSGIEADSIVTETLVEGDGPAVEDGDNVYLDLWIGNGFSRSTGYSSFGDTPQQLRAGDDLGEVIGPLVNGQQVGSRVAVIVDPKDALAAQIGSQFGIGDGDSALIIGDVVGILLDQPEGTQQQPAAWAPRIVTEKKLPTALDFAGTPEPTDDLRVTTLVKGSGQKVKKGDLLTVNYLGQVYGGAKPFDASFAKDGQPFSFTLGKGEVVKGWDQGLTGLTVGSRVIIAVPPELGYGEEGKPAAEGQPGTGIKGTDTMYFVVDVLGGV